MTDAVGYPLALAEAVKAKDAAYAERNKLVAALAKLAVKTGGDAWLGQHPASDKGWEPDWTTIVYVWFPVTGQMSWHVHDSERHLFAPLEVRTAREPYDGHSTPEKYERLARLTTTRLFSQNP